MTPSIDRNTVSRADILEECRDQCRRNPGLVAFPDSLDRRVWEAAARLEKERLAHPVLVQSPFALRTKMNAEGFFRSAFTVVDPASPARLAENVEEFLALRKAKGKEITEEQAAKAMRCPLAAAAMLVRRKDVHAGLAGNLSATADVLRAGLAVLDRKPGIRTVSSFFLMISPDGKRRFIFADCAVVPEPTAPVLADIAMASAEQARRLLKEEPRVALLSFSTKGSALHPRARLIADATRLLQERAPDLMVDGELQFDAATVPDVSALKAPGSTLQGRANVLIFPSLEAGNIGYKMVQRLAGYRAIGPFLQGFEGGWHDLSRGCSAEDIYQLAIIALCLERGAMVTQHAA
ncbi:MAG: phosphate acetyltransferase [Desulfacinum sp.]|jgi:phosphotransacetylase|nr:phosphate acetyltransferase [Desulfacinum sp.]